MLCIMHSLKHHLISKANENNLFPYAWWSDCVVTLYALCGLPLPIKCFRSTPFIEFMIPSETTTWCLLKYPHHWTHSFQDTFHEQTAKVFIDLRMLTENTKNKASATKIIHFYFGLSSTIVPSLERKSCWKLKEMESSFQCIWSDHKPKQKGKQVSCGNPCHMYRHHSPAVMCRYL